MGVKSVDLKRGRLPLRGGPSLLSGVAVAACCAALVPLPTLSGPAVTTFLAYFFIAAIAYAVAVARLGRDRLSSRTIWAFAILFRLILLLNSPPTLSTDVYRYIWDGRLMNAGANPYAYPVESPLLDRFDSPQRAMVNQREMASPYLPAAQIFFALIYRLAPDSPIAFQIAAALLDLSAGWLVMDMLSRLGLPRARALIYLWNPLVVVEFAQGAHVDALMICLSMAAFWFLIAVPAARQRRARLFTLGSVITLAAATLTKGLPGLLLPVVARRWGWRRTILCAGLIVAACLPFAWGAGWGLVGPLNGEGLLGAIRIYAAYWNYNGGLYHWLEVGLSGYPTPGPAPLEVVGWAPVMAAKLMVAFALALTLVVVWRLGQRWESPSSASEGGDQDASSPQSLALLRWAAVPPAAYLLLTTTIHPWYVTFMVPLLPFLLPKEGEITRTRRFLWPWLYFSMAVPLSYLTYFDPAHLREFDFVRLMEYAPFYMLLIWAAWSAKGANEYRRRR